MVVAAVSARPRIPSEAFRNAPFSAGDKIIGDRKVKVSLTIERFHITLLLYLHRVGLTIISFVNRCYETDKII